jgi:glycosyltransferase involved in cell wall biosynthesis
MKKQQKISILIPAYNEQDVLRPLYARLVALVDASSGFDFEFMFVNDGSRDNTLSIIKELAAEDRRVAYVSLSRNFGKEAAMLAGFDHITGDAVVIIDADLQDPPELIPQMIKYWQRGFDDVYARRVNRHGETWLKKQTSAVFYRLLQQTTHIPIQQDTGDFRLLDRRCIEALKQLRESQRYTKGMFSWIGFKKKEITYSRDPRHAGTTKWNYAKLFDLAIEGIVSFTTAPLRWSTFLGVCISLLSFIYIFILVVRTLLFGSAVAGYPSMMAAILFLGGVQLLSLGLIGEYVGRIFNETKRRPLYFVEEHHPGDDKE